MSAHFPESDPARAPGPGPGPRGGVPPGETPPGESGTGSGTGPYRPLTRGWGKGPLVLICLLALVVALFFLAYPIVLNI
ncbi:DUF6480 family protein [Streptomyces sp. NPDC087917]|uniref:DUF6480 family protein n=1 Tax=Streptomyces sp. NPDC087917 TaxID=3155060 RepID=UPI00341FE47A